MTPINDTTSLDFDPSLPIVAHEADIIRVLELFLMRLYSNALKFFLMVSIRPVLEVDLSTQSRSIIPLSSMKTRSEKVVVSKT